MHLLYKPVQKLMLITQKEPLLLLRNVKVEINANDSSQ